MCSLKNPVFFSRLSYNQEETFIKRSGKRGILKAGHFSLARVTVILGKQRKHTADATNIVVRTRGRGFMAPNPSLCPDFRPIMLPRQKGATTTSTASHSWMTILCMMNPLQPI